MMKVSIIIIIILGLMSGYIFASELSLPEYTNIAPGVWYGEVEEKSQTLIYHVIKVNIGADMVAIKPVRARKDETLVDTAKRLVSEKLPLLGSITGDYYHRITKYKIVVPWGILIDEGKVLFSPTGKSALCCTEEGVAHILVPTMKAHIRNRPDTPGVCITAVNRKIKAERDECGIYNSTWGTLAPEISQGFAIMVNGDSDFYLDRPINGTVIGINRLPVNIPISENGFVIILNKLPSPDHLELKLGSPVLVNIEVSLSPENAIGGGPRILRDGQVSIEFSAENFGPGKEFYIHHSRHPRSAVGIDSDKKNIYLLVVEGRSQKSQGVDMNTLAELMLSIGVSDAMAFDGGRSVSMYVDGKAVVKSNREIADCLGVFQIIK